MSWISKILHKSENDSQNKGARESEKHSSFNRNTSHITVAADNPIRLLEDDALGRAGGARSFTQQALSLDVREGVVVGVLGPWGSGKTSFINLSRGEFDNAGVPVLDFNPWMFSGAEQLVESFFVELAAQLKIRPELAKVGKDLEDYGEMFSGMAWLPLMGPWIERGRGAVKILGKILQRRKEGVGGRRTKLEKALADCDKPIVVVLDDIDRLSTSEIRDVFKLVRLTANFPNVIYIVAFDRGRVEKALEDQGVPGRDYLEKILQVSVDLPAVPSQVLNRQILIAIDSALSGISNPRPFDSQTWPDLFMEIIRPLVRNMRDVRRYAAAIRGTVSALNGQIALADVLALEAIRTFLPDVYDRLHGAVEALTTVSDSPLRSGSELSPLKSAIDSIVEVSGTHKEVVRAMIRRLFPAAERHIGGGGYGAEFKGRWLRERRVAHEDILRLYLERVAGEGFQAFSRAERAFGVMSNQHAFDSYLRSLDVERLEDVIGSLETFEDKFAPEHAVPGTIVLLNLLPGLPERRRGMFDWGTGLVVGRVIYRLLRLLGDPTEIEAAVRQTLPEVKCLSSKLQIIDIVGYREGAGHKLVSEAAAAQFERTWRDEVRSAMADDLVGERDLIRVLLLAKSDADPSEGPLNIDESPQLTLAMLQAARSEGLSQTMGSRAVRRSPRLGWDALVELYGDEATLRQRIDSLKATEPEGANDLLELADKYLSGWRPKHFGDE